MAVIPSLTRRILSVATPTGLAAGALGLVEGILLAVVADPFGAPWISRLLSVALFAGLYLIVGFLAGALAGAIGALAARRAPAGLLAAVAAALLGLAWGGSWGAALRHGRMISTATAAALTVAPMLLMAAAARISASRIHVAGPRAAAVAATAPLIAAVVCTGLWMTEPAGARQPSPAPVRAAADHVRPAAAPAGPPPRNVLLILADTLRADHLSAYGYERRTSPELERFAAEGITFEHAVTAKTKTSPSVASLFTGTYPYTHGIVQCRTTLDDSAVTLAEVLRQRGFATHSIVANTNVGTAFNFDQGFQSVEDLWTKEEQSLAEGVTDRALAWLSARAGKPDPFFLYVHYLDPHARYSAPAPYTDMFVGDAHAGRFAAVKVTAGDDSIGSIRDSVRLDERPTDVGFYVARYDGEIAYLDKHIGRLLDGARSMGLDADTLVIFTSDHGEALSDHDVFFSHGGFAYDDTSRVPLMIRLPGKIPAGARFGGVVQSAALAPTILEALGAPIPPSMELASFWTLAEGEERPAAEPAFVEGGHSEGDLRTAIRTGKWKLIENPKGIGTLDGRFDLETVLSVNRKEKGLEIVRSGHEFLRRYELYDVAADPGEVRNLAARETRVASGLLADLEAWRAKGKDRPRRPPTPSSELDEEVLRQLKSLGYIN